MIVLNILGYFGRNKQNSYAALNIIYAKFVDGLYLTYTEELIL